MGVTQTFAAVAALPPAQRLEFVEAALQEPYRELQAAAFQAVTDPRGLNRPDLVVLHYDDLLPEIRERVVEKKQVFLEAAMAQVRNAREHTRRAAYDILATLGDVHAAPLLSQGLRDESALVREHVSEALERLALKYHSRQINARTAHDEASRKFVETNRPAMNQTLEDLLRTFSVHRRSVFLDVAIEGGEDSYKFITDFVLARRDSPVARAFLDRVKAGQSPALIQILFRLLYEKDARLREIAVEIMSSRRDAAFAEAIAAHLAGLLPPRLAELAQRTKDLPWWPAVEANPELPVAACRKIIEFISSSALEEKARPQMLFVFTRSVHAEVRALILEALLAHRHPKILDAAEAALKDPEEAVRLAGARIVLQLNPPTKLRILTGLLSDASEPLRRLAMREVAAASFTKYMASFDKLDERTREMAAKALAKIDHSVIDHLAEEVSSLSADRRLKALQVVEYIGAEKDLRELLTGCLKDPDRRVRATVVKIVQLSGSVDGMKLLIGALADPDRRVRANAIEAFEDIGDTRLVQLLVPFLRDPDNRVRANAAKALWNLGRRDMAEVLEAMLEDADEQMRLSAVWALGEIRYEAATSLLAARVPLEPSGKVRDKIAEVLARIAERPGE